MSAFSRKTREPDTVQTERKSEDARQTTVRVLRYIVFVMLLAAVTGTVYIYRDDFNMTNFRRIISLVDMANAKSESGAGSVEIRTEYDSKYAAYKGGVGITNQDTLYFINAGGQQELSLQLGYSRPDIAASDKYLFVYDRGGKKFCGTNSYMRIFEKTLSSDIISASINKKGAICVVTDETGYRGAVTVFDTSQNESYKWYTSEYYLLSADLSPNSQNFAVICFGQNAGKFQSKIMFFSVDSKDAKASLDLGDSFVFAVKFFSNDRICVIADDRTLICDFSGQIKQQIPYKKQSLKAYSFDESGYAVLALDSGRTDARLELCVIDENKTQNESVNMNQEIKAIAASGKKIAALFSDHVSFLDKKLDSGLESIESQGAKNIIGNKNGSFILIYADRVEFVSSQ